jgi:Domain of unknown function (DUF4328)
MADYFPLIARAVAGLESNTEEARHAVYERAREALVERIGDGSLLDRERIALDSAISRVEAGIPAAEPIAYEKELSGFRNPTSLTRVLQVLLAALIALSVAAFLSNLAEYQLLQSTYTEADAAANDTRQGIIGGLYLVVFVATIIVFGRWIYRANGNARALGASGMEFTPGWSVGWYFIPVACLWKPFQAMREIWNASKNPMQWQSEPTDHILRWWWFGWITRHILGQVHLRVTLAAHDLAALSAASVIGAIDDAFHVFATALALVLITRISRMQMARCAGEVFR